MDNRRHNKIDPWDDGVYGTGRTEPPKSNSGIVALLMIIIIFLSGIISVLSFLNIQLFRQLQQNQIQTDTVPIAFSSLETEADPDQDILEDTAPELSAVRIPVLEMGGEYVSQFDQHYFSWPAGMLVTVLDPQGKGQKIGLEVGDILTEINGFPITSQETLDAFLSSDIQGPYTVTVLRDGAQLTLREDQ